MASATPCTARSNLEGWRVAPALLVAGQIDQAGELLERSAVAAAGSPNDLVAVRHYAAFLATQGKLAEQLPRWRKLAALPTTSKAANPVTKQSAETGRRLPNGSPDKRAGAVILTYLDRLHGDLAEARRAAEQSGWADLTEAVLFDQGAWADLAAMPAANSGLPPIHIGLKAMYLSAAGKTAEANAALTDLKGMTVTGMSGVAPPLVFRALMFAGRPADALAAIAKYQAIAAS